MIRPVACLLTTIGLALACSTAAWADTDSEIRAANAAEVSAIIAGDQTRLGELWADDFLVTNPFNHFVRKPQVMTLMASGIFRFTSLERTIDYVRD